MGLRVLVGRRQAVVSTNDVRGESVDALAERAVAMARAAPEDRFAGLADPADARARLSRSRPGGPRTAGRRRARGRGAPRRGGRPRRQGRQQVGRRLGLGRHRRHGAADQPRLLRRLSRLAPQHLDAGDRGRRHRHGDRLRLLLGAACGRSRCARDDRPHRRRAGGGAAQSAQGVDPQGAGGVRPARRGLAHRPSRQRHQRQRDRAQDQLPQGQARRAAVRAGHQRDRRSAAAARPALAAVRRRRRCRPAHGAGRRRRADDLAARLRDRARARPRHHRPRPARRVLDAVARADQPASRAGRGRARTN